ncbi:glycosyltransferase [Parahaliea maris]|uniref:glycosyltransferase n=1 Tax=Parahaliea maris TaxID=2716870 RepID=UPI0016502460|nr:glycosyltransferase [Parahaliea maris]
MTETSSTLELLSKLISSSKHRKPDAYILLGVGLRELLTTIYLNHSSIPIVFRLGGDPIKDLADIRVRYLTERQYLLVLSVLLREFIARLCLSRIGRAIVVNKSLVAPIAERMATSGRVAVSEHFAFGSLINKSYKVDGRVRLLVVCNLLWSSKAEGVAWLIRQLSSIASSRSTGLHIEVAGDGPHFGSLVTAVAAMNICELVEVNFCGYVQNLDELYASADIFLYKSEHDASPNVILEAKRHSMPMLVNRCLQFESLINDEENGFLYTDEDDFARKLIDLCESEETRRKLGLGAARSFKKDFSLGPASLRLDKSLKLLTS